MRRKMILAVTAVSVACNAAIAQEPTSTLEKIKSTGSISIGHRESSIPFSYYDRSEKVVGYAIDLCYLIADAVKIELDLPRLDVKLVPVTPSSRIPAVLNEKIDLECGSTSNNLERQKVVAFTITHFVTANRFVAKAASNLRTVDDLKGKTVVSTSERPISGRSAISTPSGISASTSSPPRSTARRSACWNPTARPRS